MVEAITDSNVLELPPSRKKRKKDAPSQTENNANKLSKSMRKKLEKIQEEKAKREMRVKVFETLGKHRLSEDAHALICSSGTLGKTETMREKLRRAMQYKRAGLPVPEDIPLVREKLTSDAEPQAEQNKLQGQTDTSMDTFCKSDLSVPSKRQKKDNTSPSEEKSLDLKDEKFSPVQPLVDAVISDEIMKITTNCIEDDEPMSESFRSQKYVVHVQRSEEVENQRSKLPIVMMEQEIMEALSENDVVIICGETGCGKTTQVPQFLYEAGYGLPACKDRCGMIGITQPRRVAVLTTAKRVAYEMNLELGKEVGFQVRYDRKIGDRSSMKFMTDGILLREIQTDFLLRKYSVIVLDEAHERSINTDILIGMLSRVLPLRKKLYGDQNADHGVTPLKLVVMSATLRVEDFTSNRRMFPVPPPVIQVSARQFPVTIHFSSKTELLDYETAAFKKVSAIHRKLPSGGILVFVTGRREVETLCRRLRKAFPFNGKQGELSNEFGAVDMDTLNAAFDDDEPSDDDEIFDDGNEDSFDDDDDDDDTDGEVSDIEKENEKDGKVKEVQQMHVLPLYAMLPAASQLQVFEGAPEGMRLVVVSTNVAETSVTIPGIRYVVDCGRAKERKFCTSGVSRFEVSWISKASADQRAGRSGRTGPGHCYRLYSSAHFNNNFPEFAPPEISLTPIEGVVLVLKCMGIDKVVNFPYPTPPEREALVCAEKCLTALSALDPGTGSPTVIGKAMALFPVDPRTSRMLFAALQLAPLLRESSKRSMFIAYAVALAAALSVESPFLRDGGSDAASTLDSGTRNEPGNKREGNVEEGQEQGGKVKPRAAQQRFMHPLSDALSVVNALRAYEASNERASFCRVHYLNEKTMKEMGKMRIQILRLVCQYSSRESLVGSEVDRESLLGSEVAWKQEAKELKQGEEYEKALQQVLCAGWADRVAMRLTSREKVGKSRRLEYQICDAGMEGPVYVHPTSVVRRVAPDFVVYKEIVESSSSRPYMCCVSGVDAESLLSQASYFCTYSKPLLDPSPWYDSIKDEVMCWVCPSFGPHMWKLPLHSFPLKVGRMRSGVFACALLEGKVVPGLRVFKSKLAADPTLVLKRECGEKRVFELVDRLSVSGVDSRKKLADAWRRDEMYLQKEMMSWVQSKYERELKEVWKELQAESWLSGSDLYGRKKKKKKKKPVMRA